MSDLRTVPTLDEIVADPAKVADLPPETVKCLLAKHAAVGELLLARLIAIPVAQPKPDGGEQLIGAAEVAEMLGRGKSWVEHHLDELPSRRSLLGSPVWVRADIEAWIKGLPKYGSAE
jgi:predicted DNA-binding transcriptional regulator AlpA